MKIYEPTGRAREYSPLALNYFRGCTHNCLYCYVPKMFVRYNVNYDHTHCVAPEESGYLSLENSAKKLQGCNKQILLSFTGDPYCGIETDCTTKVLQILNKHNHKVAILTKGGKRCLKDIELFQQFGERIKVGATLTFDNEKDSLEWESGAATPAERMEALKILNKKGIKTWVSLEPVIVPEQALNLLTQVAPYVDHVKIGKLNNYKGIDKDVDWSRFLEDAVTLCRKLDLKFYIKKSLLEYNKGTYLRSEEIDEDYLNL